MGVVGGDLSLVGELLRNKMRQVHVLFLQANCWMQCSHSVSAHIVDDNFFVTLVHISDILQILLID